MSSNPLRRLTCVLVLLTATWAQAQPTSESPEITALRIKAEKGNSIAQYNLGLAYSSGRDVAVDLSEAYVWLTLAAENGTTSRTLQTLLERMTPAQLAEGKNRLVAHQSDAVASDDDTADEQVSLSKEELARIEADKKQLSHELALAWKETDRLKASLEEAHNVRDRTTAELNRSSTELATLRAKVARATGDQSAKTEIELAALQKELTETKNTATALAARGQELEDIAAQRGRAIEETQAELAKAKDDLVSLQQAQVALKAELATKAKQGDLATELAKTKQALAKASENTVTAERRLGAQQSYSDDLQRQLTSMQDSLTQAKGARTDLIKQVETLTGELGQARAQLAKLQDGKTELTQARDRIASLEKAQSSLQAELAAKSDAIASQANLATELTDTRQALTKAGKDAAEEKSVLQEKLRQAVGTIATLQQELGVAQDAGAKPDPAATNRIATLQAQLTIQQATLEQEQSARAAATKQVTALSNELDATRTQLTDLQAENTELTQRLAHAASPANEAEAEARLLQAQSKRIAAEEQAKTLAAELTDTRAALSAAQTTADQQATAATAASGLQTQLDELKAEFAHTQTARAEAEDHAATLSTELENAQKELTTSKARLAEITALSPATAGDTPELADVKDKLATALRSYSQLQDVNDGLKASSDQLAAQMASLESQLASAHRDTTDLSSLVDSTTAKAAQTDALAEQLRQTRDQLNATRLENSRLRTRIAIITPPPASTLSAPTRPGSPAAVSVTASVPTPAPAPAAVPAPAPASNPRVHTVVAGDTLSQIARDYYGTSLRWAEIYEANRNKLPNERALLVGMKLVVP